MFDKNHLVHSYIRAQALADGLLVDVTELAREAGIKYPVALTRAAWEKKKEKGSGEKRKGKKKRGRESNPAPFPTWALQDLNL